MTRVRRRISRTSRPSGLFVLRLRHCSHRMVRRDTDVYSLKHSDAFFTLAPKLTLLGVGRGHIFLENYALHTFPRVSAFGNGRKRAAVSDSRNRNH